MGFRRKKGCNMNKVEKGLAITAGSFTSWRLARAWPAGTTRPA
jgi:hypothetical protein